MHDNQRKEFADTRTYLLDEPLDEAPCTRFALTVITYELNACESLGKMLPGSRSQERPEAHGAASGQIL